MSSIEAIEAFEILDSRGHPTLQVDAHTDKRCSTFRVPAGASTGQYEAVDRRDGGERYRGRGVRQAVRSINNEFGPALIGHSVGWPETDQHLVKHTNPPRFDRHGGNAVIGVSGALFRLVASHRPYRNFDKPYALPRPMMNLVSGGQHADSALQLQDLMVVPLRQAPLRGLLHDLFQVRASLRDQLSEAGLSTLVADEGGFAPALSGHDELFERVLDAVQDAGFRPGDDIALSLDVAASQFYRPEQGRYRMQQGVVKPGALFETILSWDETYPIVSIEDPFHENAREHWITLHQQAEALIVGDDLTATRPERSKQAFQDGLIDTLLVKPNQTGTFRRAHRAAQVARDHDGRLVMSARSGETADTTMVDFGVGVQADFIKIGSLCRSERTAKYNRLLALDQRTDLSVRPLSI